jgi:hypothetical protein
MTVIDMTESIAPKSDQANADDFMSGPRTFTIAAVRPMNSDEQPFAFELAEFPAGRPYKPSKTMRRVMVLAWGADASQYIGRRLTLYRDPEVKFGGSKVGGIKISQMSHLAGGKAMQMMLTETRGKRTPHKVEPLPDNAPASSPAVSAETLAELTSTFRRKGVPEGDWLKGVNHYTKGAATALEDQARVVLDVLAQRPDVAAPVAADEGDPCPVCGAVDGNHDDDVHEAAGA